MRFTIKWRPRWRRWISLATAILLAIGFTTQTYRSTMPFEERATREDFVKRAREGGNCPLPREKIFAEEHLFFLTICEEHGLLAYEYARRYPKISPAMFWTYGEDPDFHEVLDRLGHEVIPVVWFFVEKNSREFQIRNKAGQVLKRVTGKIEKLEDLTKEQVGLYAIHEMQRRGHEFLAEFEVVDKVAHRREGTRALYFAKDFVFGNATNLEKVVVRGDRLATIPEVGLAMLDLSVVGGTAVKVFTKSARATKGAREIRKVTTVTSRVDRGVQIGKTTAKWTAGAVVVAAVTLPNLFFPFMEWAASKAAAWIGVPVWTLIFGFWFIVWTICIFVLERMVRGIRLAIAPAFWGFRLARYCIRIGRVVARKALAALRAARR